MQKVTLVSVGSIKTPWISEGCVHYALRTGVDTISLIASKQKDPKRQKKEESERVLAALKGMNGDVWVLDESGEGMTSKEFASLLQRQKDEGVHTIFVLGGAYGLTDAVRDRADRIIALSSMTLPHELCALVFLEQLYRASEIQKGSGYHH